MTEYAPELSLVTRGPPLSPWQESLPPSPDDTNHKVYFNIHDISQLSQCLTPGTEHVVPDVVAGVLHGAGGALAVGHRVDCHLLQNVGLTSSRALGAPA